MGLVGLLTGYETAVVGLIERSEEGMFTEKVFVSSIPFDVW